MSEFHREMFLARIAPEVKQDTYLQVWAEDEEMKFVGIGLGNTVLVKRLDGEIENVAFEDVKGMRLE